MRQAAIIQAAHQPEHQIIQREGRRREAERQVYGNAKQHGNGDAGQHQPRCTGAAPGQRQQQQQRQPGPGQATNGHADHPGTEEIAGQHRAQRRTAGWPQHIGGSQRIAKQCLCRRSRCTQPGPDQQRKARARQSQFDEQAARQFGIACPQRRKIDRPQRQRGQCQHGTEQGEACPHAASAFRSRAISAGIAAPPHRKARPSASTWVTRNWRSAGC